VRWFLAACLLCLAGCGRFWFDPQAEPVDAGIDATAPDGGPVGAPWWDPAFTRRGKIILRSSVSTTETGVPVLLRLDATRMDVGATAADAADLRFLAQDHSTLLPHEVEAWGPEGGLIWVRLPEVPPEPALTWVWMYYGNPGAPDASRPARVWEGDYAAVYHLAGDARDATGRGNDGTVAGATFATAFVGEGLSFEAASGSHVVIDDGPELHGLGRFTFSAWVRRRASQPDYAAIVSRRFGAGGLNDFWVGFIDDRFGAGMVSSDDPTSNVHIVADDVAPLNEWVYFAAAYDGSELCLHLNGLELSPATRAIAGPTAESPQPIYLGADSNDSPVPNDDFLTADLDEVRIETVSRSDAWLSLQVASMTDQLVEHSSVETR